MRDHRDLEVWQKALDLAAEIYRLTALFSACRTIWVAIADAPLRSACAKHNLSLQEVVQPGLEYRRFSALQHLNLSLVHIDAQDVFPSVRKAGASDQSNITGAKDRQTQVGANCRNRIGKL